MGILASAKPGSHCKANRLDLTPFQLARFCCSAERACGALEGARLRGKLDHRLAQRLRRGDMLGKGQAQRGVAEREVEAVGIEPRQPPFAVLGAEQFCRIEPDRFEIGRASW